MVGECKQAYEEVQVGLRGRGGRMEVDFVWAHYGAHASVDFVCVTLPHLHHLDRPCHPVACSHLLSLLRDTYQSLRDLEAS